MKIINNNYKQECLGNRTRKKEEEVENKRRSG